MALSTVVQPSNQGTMAGILYPLLRVVDLAGDAPLPARSFSAHVLTRMTARLLVLPVKGVGWADWGHPRRVLTSLARRGSRPGWLDGVEAAFSA